MSRPGAIYWGGSAAEQRGDRAVELKISFPEVLL